MLVAFDLPSFARFSFLRWEMSGRLDDWLRELYRAGLSTAEQQDLLQRLSQTIGRRTRYFPDSPLACMGRVKEFLLSAFLPQKGPLSIAGSPDEARKQFRAVGLGSWFIRSSPCWMMLAYH